MSAQDARHLPFCFQTHAALDLIRDRFSGAKLSTALSVYLVLTEVANRKGGAKARNGFGATRREIAALVGVSVDTVDRYISDFEEIGLLEVERREIEGSNLPNLWCLIDAPPVTPSDTGDATPATPSRTDAATPSRTSAALTRAQVRVKPKKKDIQPKKEELLPRVVKVDGRDLAFDALAAETGFDVKVHGSEIALALNGRGSVVGIREQAFDSWVAQHSLEAFHEALARDPEDWERWLAAEIHRKSDLYRQKMGEAILTPTALRKWWGPLEHVSEDRVASILRRAGAL